MNPLRPLLAVLDAARDTISEASVRFAFGHDEDPDDCGLVLRVAGWHLQVDADGLMFVRHGGVPLEDPVENDASHCCGCDHPDRSCDHDVTYGFREDDLVMLFGAVERGSLTAEVAMAEFVTGVRAEPDDEEVGDE